MKKIHHSLFENACIIVGKMIFPKYIGDKKHQNGEMAGGVVLCDGIGLCESLRKFEMKPWWTTYVQVVI